MEPLQQTRPRRLEDKVLELMRDEPVIVLTGPRTVGKSTLMHTLGARLERDILDLDDITTRAVVRDDLTSFVSSDRPVLIDEFQLVPEMLDAIKAELNRDGGPGQFILAGSTRYGSLPLTAQSLTGRVHVETVWPLSQGELLGTRESFVDRLLESAIGVQSSAMQLDGPPYVERVLAGGLPAALRRSAGRPRSRWFDNYVSLVVQRDVLEIKNIRQSSALPHFLQHLAAQTGQILNAAQASRRASVSTSTGEDYVRLLESVFLIHRLPAWGSTLQARINRLPKVHLVDTGLCGWLLGLSVASVNRRIPAVLTEFGHLLETFVVNEVLKQIGWSDRSYQAGHYRTSDGHEVDLVLETDDGDVVAIEVKAGGTYREEDLRGLRQLRSRLGRRFRAGALIYTGSRSAAVDDRLALVELKQLWS